MYIFHFKTLIYVCMYICSESGSVVHNDVDPAILLLGPACKRVGFENVPDKNDFSIR